MLVKNNYTQNYTKSLQNNKQSFKAKFLHSDALAQIAQYAVEKGKFEKLNTSRKNIAGLMLKTRLHVEIGKMANGFPCLIITRYVPKASVIVPKTMEDYVIEKTSIYVSQNEKNPLKFALKKLIHMGQCVPENKMFRQVVMDKKQNTAIY